MRSKHVSALSAVHPPAPPAALRGQWLLLARTAWVIVATFVVVLFVAAIPVAFEHLRSVCIDIRCEAGPTPPPGAQALQGLGISPTVYAAYYLTLDGIVALV